MTDKKSKIIESINSVKSESGLYYVFVSDKIDEELRNILFEIENVIVQTADHEMFNNIENYNKLIIVARPNNHNIKKPETYSMNITPNVSDQIWEYTIKDDTNDKIIYHI